MTPIELVDMLKQIPTFRTYRAKDSFESKAFDVIESIPAMLASERKQAFLEAVNLVCHFCAKGIEMTISQPTAVLEQDDGAWWHKGISHYDGTRPITGYLGECKASEIHRKLAEEVKG